MARRRLFNKVVEETLGLENQTETEVEDLDIITCRDNAEKEDDEVKTSIIPQGEETQDDVEEALRVIHSLESMVDRLKVSLESGGLSRNEMDYLKLGLEGLVQSQRLDTDKLNVISLESFNAGYSRDETQEVINYVEASIEGILDKIKNTVKNIFNRIKSFFYTIVKQFRTMEGRLKNIEKNAHKLTNLDDKDAEVTLPRCGFFEVDGDLDVIKALEKVEHFFHQEFETDEWKRGVDGFLNIVNNLVNVSGRKDGITPESIEKIVKEEVDLITRSPKGDWSRKEQASKGRVQYRVDLTDNVEVIRNMPTDKNPYVDMPYDVRARRTERKVRIKPPTDEALKSIIAHCRSMNKIMDKFFDSAEELGDNINDTLNRINSVKSFAIKGSRDTMTREDRTAIGSIFSIFTLGILNYIVHGTKNDTEKQLDNFIKDTFKVVYHVGKTTEYSVSLVWDLYLDYCYPAIVYLENTIALADRSN